MSDSTTDGWFFAHRREKHGPVAWSRLQHLAKTGWLAPGDLVWHPSLPAWTPADQIPGLHQGPLARMLRSAIPGVRAPATAAAHPPPAPPTPPVPPAQPTPAADAPRSRKRRSRSSRRSQAATFDIEAVPLRHLIAVCGVLLVALGIAFTVIRPSSLAVAVTASGLFIVAAGLAVDIGRLAARVARRLADEWRTSAAHRLRAQELALEQKRLELEAARLAAGEPPAQASPPLASGSAASGSAAAAPAAATAVEPAGRLVVINEQPVRRWSRIVAGLLSSACPGLGQFYKGQPLNGIVWLFLVFYAYITVGAPGIFLHVCCVLGALSGNPWTEARTTVVRE
jgi:hypothetical protein